MQWSASVQPPCRTSLVDMLSSCSVPAANCWKDTGPWDSKTTDLQTHTFLKPAIYRKDCMLETTMW